MRKIKPKKKVIEKKHEHLANLIKEIFYFHEEKHDIKKVREVAKKILDLNPKNQIALESVASICIDDNEPNLAERAVDLLEKNFPPSPRVSYLRSRICNFKQDYGGCVKAAEAALSFKEVDMLTRMMCHNILGHAYRFAGDAPNSLKNYEQSGKMNFDGLEDYPHLKIVQRIRWEDYSNLLFVLHSTNVSREKLFEEICGFAKLYEHIEPFTHSPKTHPRHKKIRIGYVSPDIRRHVVAFFSYAFFKSYDKSRFEVYAYARNLEDKVSAEFKQCIDEFRNILFDDPKSAAQRIKDDEIDILIDLSGHTADNCLSVMVYKPAPIQISAIGWFNTTGVRTIDYFMVDKFTDPEGLNEKFFTEKLLRLQHSHFCYMWHDAPAEISPAPFTKNGYITFVSFNMFTKVTDEMLRVWAKIINSVPNSRLYLKGKAFRDQFGTDKALARIAAAGIPLDRLDYERDEPAYLEKYNRADIALDTFPYPGGGTTCDALYMGLPVITLVGERHNSRFGYSLLHNIGLDELCAFSEEEYIKKAVDLANDPERLRDYHLTIRRKMEMSPVMDDTIYMGEVEAAYEKIFRAWQNGEELPNFPQEEEIPSEKQAEKFYDRAENYIQLSGESKNPVNIKRALYYLNLAKPADKKHDAEIYLKSAACKQELLDFVGAYDDILECGKIIYEQTDPKNFSKVFLRQYHERRGNLALRNCKPTDAIDNFEAAANVLNDEKKFSFASSALLSLNFLELPEEDLAAAHFEFQKLVDEIKPFKTYHERGEKIKIGYISADFRKHATFPINLGIVSCHDQKKFDVTCYSRNERDDEYTEIFKGNVKNFVNVRELDFEELAKKIHSDKIDVLVDLSGHSGGNVLPMFAYKPAPIQISGIGYMATTGLKSMDYFITDETVDPPGMHEKFFSEKLLYLPGQFCYALRSDVPEPQPAPCIKNNFVTLGTICRYSKISDDMLRVWKEILDRLPTAQLVMRALEFESLSTVSQAYSRMKNLGIDMDRVQFRPPSQNYMNELIKLDLILDAYPYVGGSTTLDALYMGVPVLTLYSERRSTRLGLGILKNVGLEDLAVTSVQDYIDRAIALATDTETLDVLHKNIRMMFIKAPAMITGNYVRSFEEKILQILDAQ